MQHELIIAPQTEGKSRSFRATLLASVEADSVWEGGQTATDNQRPVWAMFASSENELRPFVANLVSGRKAAYVRQDSRWSRKKDDRLEILRSAGFKSHWQREAEGSIATVLLPDLFQIDPGMVDPKGASFILLPTKASLAEHTIDVAPSVQHMKRFEYPVDDARVAELVPMAYHFCTWLDRRTRQPIYADGRFYMQLMLACLHEGLASFSYDDGKHRWGGQADKFGRHQHFRFVENGTSDVGLADGIVFKATHDEIDRVLAEQVALFSHTTGVH